MVPIRMVEAQVRREFAALQRPGLRYEEERDFSWGRDVLRIRVSWKDVAAPRRHIGVYLDFTRNTVRTQPRINHAELDAADLGWIATLVQTVPGSDGDAGAPRTVALTPALAG